MWIDLVREITFVFAFTCHRGATDIHRRRDPRDAPPGSPAGSRSRVVQSHKKPHYTLARNGNPLFLRRLRETRARGSLSSACNQHHARDRGPRGMASVVQSQGRVASKFKRVTWRVSAAVIGRRAFSPARCSPHLTFPANEMNLRPATR